jgi:biopolymer transport protein TolR
MCAVAGTRDRFATSAPSVSSEINVTPLVDVCLVLLIIFMVIAPMLQTGAPVQLPNTDRPPDVKREEKQLTVSLGFDLGVFLESDRYAKSIDSATEMQQFVIKLKDVYTRTPDRKILVKADKRLSFGKVRDLMRYVQEAGFSNVGLISDKSKQRG